MISFLPNSRYFGIHIGHRTVTAAYLGSFGKPAIKGVGITTLERSPWLKNGLRDNEQVSAAISQAIASAQPHPITLKQAVLTLPETAVFTKTLKLPALSKKELLQTIPYEAAEALPLPIEEVYLDWRIDDRKIVEEKGAKPMQRVLVVAAPKKTVDDLTDIVANAGLEMVALESEPFSLLRALQPSLQAKVTSIVCNIGQETSTIVVTNREQIIFTSTLLLGRKKLKADQNTQTRRLVDEINESVKYYRSRLGEKDSIQSIVVTGEGALLPGLTEAIEKGTDTTCRVGRADIHLPDNSAIHPRYTTAIGVALWTKSI